MAIWLDVKPEQATLIDTDWIETAEQDAPVLIRDLLSGISYGASYVDDVVNAAAELGVTHSTYAFVSFAREVASEPAVGRAANGDLFCGFFRYHPRSRSVAGAETEIANLRMGMQKVVFKILAGEMPAKGIRLIAKRCGLDQGAVQVLLASLPAILPPTTPQLASGLAIYLDRSEVRYERTLIEEGDFAALADLVARGLRESADGTGFTLLEAIEGAMGKINDAAARKRVDDSQIWFSPSAASNLRGWWHELDLPPDQLHERLSDSTAFGTEEVPIPILRIGRVVFARSVGANNLIAAVQGPD